MVKPLFSETLERKKLGREMSWYERIRATAGVAVDNLVSVVASAIMPKKVKWLWPNRVPLGKLTLFVGDPDNGKSMVSTYVAATVTTGRDWFDVNDPAPSGEVMIFASEDDLEDTAVPRLMAAGADRNKVHFAKMACRGNAKEAQVEREMQLDKDIQAIKKALDANGNVRLVVIDPVSNYLGDVNMNDEQEVRQTLSPLQKLAAETSVAIIGIMHLNKKGDLKAINRVGGAMAFVGVARAVWVFVRDGEDPDVFHMVGVKKNIGERIGGLKYRIITKAVKIDDEDVQEPYVDWLGKSGQAVDDILPVKSVGRSREEREQAAAWLKKLLSNGPVPSREIEAQSEAARFKYRTLERVKDEPDSGVEVFREGDKWHWKLKD